MNNEKKPTVPYVLSLIAGVLTLIGGLTTVYAGLWRFNFIGQMMRRYGFANGHIARSTSNMVYAFAAGPGHFSSLISFAGMLGIIFGLVVIVSAIMLNRRPVQHTTCGILILVFSILGIFGGLGGYLVGLILGIVGGALAIAWKPPTAT